MAHLLWTQKQDIGPSARSRFGLAYDSVRKFVYMFGGSPKLSDTWQWDGRYWTQISRFGPPRRIGHSMAFDSARRHTVLFGGLTSSGQDVRDTWFFDGVDWTQVEDIGPAPRSEHTVAYDESRERLVLFGGFQHGPLRAMGDTWEWDGATWTQMELTGPAPRAGHSMAYDTSTERTVIFGGIAAIGPDGALRLANDTWEWDGTTWTQLADTGPTARSHAAMASAGGALILHGGDGVQSLADTWQWVSGTWSKVQEFGPTPRHAHAMTTDTERQKLVLFGGEAEQSTGPPVAPVVHRFGDTWEAPARGH